MHFCREIFFPSIFVPFSIFLLGWHSSKVMDAMFYQPVHFILKIIWIFDSTPFSISSLLNRRNPKKKFLKVLPKLYMHFCEKKWIITLQLFCSCADLDERPFNSRIPSNQLRVPTAMLSMDVWLPPSSFVDKWGLIDVGQLGPAGR